AERCNRAAGPPRLGEGVLEGGERLARLLCEDVACRRRNDGPARSLEQRDAERGLDGPDRARQGGLCDLQSLGGASEMEILVHAQEVADVPEADRGGRAGRAPAAVRTEMGITHGHRQSPQARRRVLRDLPSSTTRIHYGRRGTAASNTHSDHPRYPPRPEIRPT